MPEGTSTTPLISRISKASPDGIIQRVKGLGVSLCGICFRFELRIDQWPWFKRFCFGMMITIKYGKGLIFHTPMGHENGKSIQCVGFITTLNRSAEWLATGKVTQSLPKNFPTKTEVSLAK